VHVTGGDPLLHDHLPQILHTLKKQGNFTMLTSPCIRIDQLPLNILKLIDLIFCYMPGVDNSSIRENTGYDVYAQYYLTLSSLHEQKRKVIVTYPINPENASTIPDIYNLTSRLKHYLLLTHDRTTGKIPREYIKYYCQRPTVIGYSYNRTQQKTCLGCPQKLWRANPFSLKALALGFYKLYL
jgi:pyruvate-formate lyase-activating enzyme